MTQARPPGAPSSSYFFLLPSYRYHRADYCFCAAAFCSPRLCRRGSPFPCFALSRRHCSTTSTALGRQPECVDDQLLGCFLSFIHVFAFLLGRLSVSIRPDWYGLWRHSWLARAGDYPLGKPTGRTFLHAEPLAPLLVTLAIAARFVYGWWRATHSGSNAPGDQHWLITASGTQLSVAVAAGLIGYYLVYSVGVRLRVARHEQRRFS